MANKAKTARETKQVERMIKDIPKLKQKAEECKVSKTNLIAELQRNEEYLPKLKTEFTDVIKKI